MVDQLLPTESCAPPPILGNERTLKKNQILPFCFVFVFGDLSVCGPTRTSEEEKSVSSPHYFVRIWLTSLELLNNSIDIVSLFCSEVNENLSPIKNLYYRYI